MQYIRPRNRGLFCKKAAPVVRRRYIPGIPGIIRRTALKTQLGWGLDGFKKKQSIVFIFNRQTLTEQEKYRERGRETDRDRVKRQIQRQRQ